MHLRCDSLGSRVTRLEALFTRETESMLRGESSQEHGAESQPHPDRIFATSLVKAMTHEYWVATVRHL